MARQQRRKRWRSIKQHGENQKSGSASGETSIINSVSWRGEKHLGISDVLSA